MFGTNPSPPSRFEAGIFDVVTNRVTQVVTNNVSITNFVAQVVTVTNEVGVIRTNVVLSTEVIPQYVTVTNIHEQYTFTPKQVVSDTAQTAGNIGNLIVPGSGGLIAGIIAGLAAAWARLRSAKQTGAVLAQNIETLRVFLKTLPNGAKYDSVLTQFMQANQAESGVLNQVLTILQNNVSNSDAQNAVREIQNALAELNKP